jgi:cytidylate kinase
MDNLSPVITIDGVGGAGKGTLSLLLAKKLQWHLLDSGAIYRVLAFSVQQHHISQENEAALSAHALALEVNFSLTASETTRVLLEGREITEDIRSPVCGNLASRISAYPGVRAALLKKQRDFRQQPGLVADGRDMGTVVFPEANFKIFLTAAAEVRAARRYAQLQAKGISVSLADVLKELVERDKRDSERSVAPLKPAEDAWILDTTTLTVEETFARISEEVDKRRSGKQW